MSKVPQEVKDALDKAQRQKNMNDMLNQLNPDEHNFNTMLMAFVDVIQTTFYEGLRAHTKTVDEKNEIDQRINGVVNQIIGILNTDCENNVQDMIVLSTVMIECITKTLMEQYNTGSTIKPTI